MRSRLLALVMVVLMVSMAACADDGPAPGTAVEEPVVEEPGDEAQPAGGTELDVVYGTLEHREL